MGYPIHAANAILVVILAGQDILPPLYVWNEVLN